MRTTLALFVIGAGLLTPTACAPTVSSSAGAFVNAVPKPSSTDLVHPSFSPKQPGWLRAGYAKQSLIYVAVDNQVAIFPESGVNRAQIGSITDGVSGAYGLFVDGKRNLFVANSSTITAYHPGTLSPYIVYKDPASPLYIVKNHAGRLYAANRNGTVTEYAPRHTRPDRTLQTPGMEADGINVDDASNLYVAYRDTSGTGSIEEFRPNSKKGRILGMQLIEPQGVQLDHSGNILVVETGGKWVVDIFSPGKTTPSQVVQAPPGSTQIVLREANENMYVSNWARNQVNIEMSHYPPGEFDKKINAALNGVEGMALSNEER